MTIRARLLATLKEPQRYVALKDFGRWRILDRAATRMLPAPSDADLAIDHAADLNASHRLKRLSEEIAEMHVMLDIQPPGTGPFTRENKALEQFRAAILAIGEDNEHS